MSKFDEIIDRCKNSFTQKLKRSDFDEDLIRAIAKSLGPFLYNNDYSKVACSDSAELEKIKRTFLVKKLGLSEDSQLDEAIKDVCNQMGPSNRNKYRVVFYYLLVEKFEKQDLFIQPKKENLSAQKESKEKGESASDQQSDLKNGTQSSEKTPVDIIHNYALYAAGAGLIPIPLIDLASISGVQYTMIKKLAAQHEHVTFDHKKTKSVLAAMMGGIGSFQLGIIARLMFRGIPIVGPIIGGTAMSGFAYFATKLIGEIFNDHFSSGGDLSIEELTVQKMKDTFDQGLKKKKGFADSSLRSE